MFSRQLTAALLCCVVAFGHAPAWLHVASCASADCQDASCVDASLAASLCGGESPACCSRTNPFAGRHSNAATTEQVADSPSKPCSDHTPGEHSSDDCTICQSLISVVGQVAFEASPCVTLDPIHFAFFQASDAPSEGVSLTLYLRGPPSC